MSLILDALNRSRHDADPVPGIATQHAVQDLTPVWKRWLPWAALAVACLVIVVLLMRGGDDGAIEGTVAAPVADLTSNLSSAAASVTTELKQRVAEKQGGQQAVQQGAQQTTAAAAPQAATVPAAPPAMAPPPVPAPATPAPAPAPSSSGATAAPQAQTAAAPPEPDPAVADLYRQNEATAPGAVQPSRTAPRAAVPEAAAKPLVRPAPAPAPAPVVEEVVDIEQMLSLAQDEMENVGLQEHPAPFLSELSQRAKDGIPTLLYQRHDYSDRAGQSRIVINGKSLGAGQTVSGGVKVDEILPGSAVFSQKGTQFRLRALNSWVNL